MAHDRHSDFVNHLENKGISLQLVEQGENLVAQSSKVANISYLVAPTTTGFRASTIGADGNVAEIYRGPKRDEAALACLCAEAVAQGIQKSWFRGARNEISMSENLPAAKGSVFEDQHGNRIESQGAYPDRKYLCYDKDRNPIRSFTDPRLASAYMSVLSDADRNPTQNLGQARDPLFNPEMRKFTLEITQMPHIVKAPDGSASMVVVGREQRQDGAKEHRLPLRGDRAKALEIVLKTRKFDINNPVRIDVETELKPQRVMSQGTGSMRTTMIREISTASVHPTKVKTADMNAMVA